jgi:transcriptional regulator GlxA family with amidase domain
MKLAYIIFDGITWLDLIGVYEPISKLKSSQFLSPLDWDICCFKETAEDSYGLQMKPTKIGQSLDGYDAIIVPGGIGTRKLQYDENFLSWIRTAGNARYKISVCTGSLILGAAGFLKDKKATTNFNEYGALKPYCEQVLTDRIVHDGNTITAGAVTSSIDLGLYLCTIWVGPEVAQNIRKRIDYHG